jgi:hypothetical protein
MKPENAAMSQPPIPASAPYRVTTYCGCCHDTRAHYRRDEFADAKRDCYECAKCNHLVFVAKGSAK